MTVALYAYVYNQSCRTKDFADYTRLAVLINSN